MLLLQAFEGPVIHTAVPLSISIRPSGCEMLVLAGFIVGLSIYLIGGPQWIDNHLPEAWTDSSKIKILVELEKKLFFFVGFSFWVFSFDFCYYSRGLGIH